MFHAHWAESALTGLCLLKAVNSRIALFICLSSVNTAAAARAALPFQAGNADTNGSTLFNTRPRCIKAWEPFLVSLLFFSRSLSFLVLLESTLSTKRPAKCEEWMQVHISPRIVKWPAFGGKGSQWLYCCINICVLFVWQKAYESK